MVSKKSGNRNICQKFKLALISTSSKIWWRSDDPRTN